MIRIFRHYIPKWLLILGTSEAVILFASVYLGFSIRLLEFDPSDKLLVGQLWSRGLVFSIVMMGLMSSVGLYQRAMRDSIQGVLFRVGVAFLAGIIVFSSFLTFFPWLSVGQHSFGLAFVASATGVILFRTLVVKYSDSELFKRRVLVIGTGELAAQIESHRRTEEWQDVALVGYVNLRDEPILVPKTAVLKVETSLLDLVVETRANEIVVATRGHREHFPVTEILDCKMNGIAVRDLISFFEQVTGKINLDALNPSNLIFSDGYVQAIIKTYLHRGFDIGVALVFVALTWPVMLLTALAIFLESKLHGPIFYRQVRVGRDGKLFEIMKFRSMSVDAEKGGSPKWAQENDSRVTLVGGFIRKVRIDEFPQLINVLKGDMSFVGPRPERPEFVAGLSERIEYFDLRHRVNPGITGWAQVCYPYGASEEDAREKLQYDLYYIKNYSLFLDIMILVQTAQVILWGKGAR